MQWLNDISLELTGAKSPFLPDVRSAKSTSENELNSSTDEGLTWNGLKYKWTLNHNKQSSFFCYLACPLNQFYLITVSKCYYKTTYNYHPITISLTEQVRTGLNTMGLTNEMNVSSKEGRLLLWYGGKSFTETCLLIVQGRNCVAE